MKRLYFLFAVFVVGCVYSPNPIFWPAAATMSDNNLPVQRDKMVPDKPVSQSPVIHQHCPNDMVYVHGEFCDNIKQVCAEWIENPNTNKFARCKKYQKPTCLSKQLKHLEFCIDKYEYTNPGSDLPLTQINMAEAEVICNNDNKRLCLESEWEFACTGNDMNIYPTGLERSGNICNYDRVDFVKQIGKLKETLVPSRSLEACQSEFGIVAMTGNVDEITVRDVSAGQYKLALHGGWAAPLRNQCVAATTAHSEAFKDEVVGFRCCSNVQ